MEAVHTLAVRYASRFPADAARRLEAIPISELGSFLAELEPTNAVTVIEGMLPSTVASAFEIMAPDELTAILELLPVSRCVLILRSLEKEKRTAVIDLLPTATVPAVERLLRSSPGTAGILAEPAQALLSPDMSVAEARDIAGGVAGFYVYVVDDDHRLVGVIHRKELASSNPRTPVRSLMTARVVQLPAAAPHSAVRDHPAWNDFHELPVVDDSGVLVGVVRHRSVRHSEPTPRVASDSPQSGFATFLELGELYWVGLTSVVTAMADRSAPERHSEVRYDR